MTEKEILISKALDKKQSAFDNSMITFTNFLSVDERSDVLAIERELNPEIITRYYGGYEEAERTIALYIPAFYEMGNSIFDFFDENEDENPLCAIRLTKDRFSNLSHRDYLGALMGLGIKREMLGDIITVDDGCFVLCMKSVSRYVCENLKKSGRGSVTCEIQPVNHLPVQNESVVEIFLSVASLRLDNIVSGGFNLSRNLASEAISKGIVFVNSRTTEKNDFLVKEKDKVVLRGKGKIVLSEIIGKSKKGRIRIKIKVYK